MLFRQFHNEKGITLVELLAALSLFTLLITLSSTIIVQMLSDEETISDGVSLSQATNVMISELRDQFYEGNSKLCIVGNDKTITVSQYSITNGDDNVIINDDRCMENINNDNPLTIRLTAANNSGDSMPIETTFSSRDDFEITVTTGNNDFDDKEDFEDIDKGDPDNYTPGNTQNNCEFYGNTKFFQTQIGNWNSCKNPTVNDGSTWFPNNISIYSNIDFTVDENFFSDKNFNLESNSKLIIKNNARLNDLSKLKSNSSIEVKNIYFMDNLILQSNSTLHAYGGARIDGTIMVQSNSDFLIDNHLFALNNTTLQENTDTLIGKTATFEKYLKMMGNASLTIGGNATFIDAVDIHSNTKIIIKGDAHFSGSVGPNWSKGEICVEGEATFNSTIGSNLQIKENATNCN